jgi:hypothetical protein
MSYNLEEANGGYLSLTAAGLAEGTNANTFKTVNTLAFTADGVFKSKGATDNIAFSSGATVVPASSACLFAVWINASGTVSTTQGPIVASTDECPVPATVGGLALVGLIKVVTDGSTTFTAGSTDLGASGITDTYYDCSVMPGASL